MLILAEGIRISTNVRVTVRDLAGFIEHVRDIHNKVTNGYLNKLRDARMGIVTDLTVSHVAWGSGTAAPAATQTQLVTELGRKALTDRTAGGTGAMTDTLYIAPDEALVEINELGGFVGGTMAPNSGTMIWRVLYDHPQNPKTNRQSIQIDRTDTFSEYVA